MIRTGVLRPNPDSYSSLCRVRIGATRFQDEERIADVSISEQTPAVTFAGCNEPQVKNVMKLCTSYANNCELALGHAGSGGLFMQQSSIPDNFLKYSSSVTGGQRRAALGIWFS